MPGPRPLLSCWYGLLGSTGTLFLTEDRKR